MFAKKCKEFRKKSQKSTHLLRCTKCRSHVGYWYITTHFSFSNYPTSIKWFVSWTVGNRLLKPLCSKMLDWLNFRFGVMIGLIHALEKRYSQNKTQLRYNFGSVYIRFLNRLYKFCGVWPGRPISKTENGLIWIWCLRPISNSAFIFRKIGVLGHTQTLRLLRLFSVCQSIRLFRVRPEICRTFR